MAEFAFSQVTRIDVTARNDAWFNQVEDVKVFIGTTLCGTLPGTVERAKLYPITCDATGDYVKLVRGGDIKEMGFA